MTSSITPRQIATEKRRLIKSILDIAKPHMWKSDYNRLFVWAPRDAMGVPKFGFTIPGYGHVEAITEYGVVDDEVGVGMAVSDFRDIPLERLIYIERWAVSHFTKQQNRSHHYEIPTEEVMNSQPETDFYVQPTEMGGVTVVCRDCAFTYFGSDLASHEPNERERGFLRGLNLKDGVVCVRCRRVVRV